MGGNPLSGFTLFWMFLGANRNLTNVNVHTFIFNVISDHNFYPWVLFCHHKLIINRLVSNFFFLAIAFLRSIICAALQPVLSWRQTRLVLPVPLSPLQIHHVDWCWLKCKECNYSIILTCRSLLQSGIRKPICVNIL